MSAQALRLVLAFILVFHGVGHALGILPAFGITLGKNHAAGSWLFGEATGTGGLREVGFALWSVTLLGFLAAGLSLLGWLVPQSWWQTLAIGSAMLSILTLAVFWWGLPLLFPHKVGATAVNVAVLVCLLWLRWPSVLLRP
jgi:hypothetical protein